ncbi:MAG: hypothetical protein ACPKMZ_02255 [Pleomorphochaeta sp.]
MNEYIGVQTFSVKAKRGKAKKFQIESTDIPPCNIQEEKSKKG